MLEYVHNPSDIINIWVYVLPRQLIKNLATKCRSQTDGLYSNEHYCLLVQEAFCAYTNPHTSQNSAVGEINVRILFALFSIGRWWLIGPQTPWSKQWNDKCLWNIKTFTWQKFWKIIVDWICAEDVRVSLSLKLTVRRESISLANIESTLRQMDGRKVRFSGLYRWILYPEFVSHGRTYQA